MGVDQAQRWYQIMVAVDGAFCDALLEMFVKSDFMVKIKNIYMFFRNWSTKIKMIHTKEPKFA